MVISLCIFLCFETVFRSNNPQHVVLAVWLKYTYHETFVLYGFYFFWNNVDTFRTHGLYTKSESLLQCKNQWLEYVILSQFPEWIKMHHRAYLEWQDIPVQAPQELLFAF